MRVAGAARGGGRTLLSLGHPGPDVIDAIQYSRHGVMLWYTRANVIC